MDFIRRAVHIMVEDLFQSSIENTAITVEAARDCFHSVGGQKAE